ncbi:MAG TPA: hypothetical protein VKZ84_05085 [Bacteriovoracaceae bacterium]|nr:hypothetical protein [Bacteriovoracaceae bacterium]
MNLVTTADLPYSINYFQAPDEMKLKLSKDQFCFLVESAKEGEGIYWGKELEFTPLNNQDLVIIPSGLYYGLSPKLSILEFRSNRELDLLVSTGERHLSPKIYPFNHLHSSYFFSHNDFSLQKVNAEQILCLSQKTEMCLVLNLMSKEIKYFGN